MRQSYWMLVVPLLLFVVAIPLAYRWRKLECHKQAVKIIEDCGGNVDQCSSGEYRNKPEWVQKMFSLEWDDLWTQVTIHGKYSEWPERFIPPGGTDLQLAQLRNLRYINEVVIIADEVSDDQLKYLEGLNEVEELHFGKTKINGSGLQYLKGMGKLRRLYFHDSHITDSIRHIPKLDSLKKLGLGGTDITDKDLKYLNRLANLRELNLSETNICGTGLAGLDELVNLKDLSAMGTPFSDEGLRHLHKFPELRYLCLIKTKLNYHRLQGGGFGDSRLKPDLCGRFTLIRR